MRAKHYVTLTINEARALRMCANGDGLDSLQNTLERAIRRIERAEAAALKRGWRP